MSNTYLDRQEDELLFLKEVFREDIEDLREKDPWKMNRAPEIKMKIFPDKSLDEETRKKIFLVLKVNYPTNYPDDVPQFDIKEYRGVTDIAIKRLARELTQFSQEHLGEVMMFEVIMLVQKFLDKNDQNRLPSLHKEMLIRKEQEEIAKEKKEKQEQAKLEKEIEEAIKKQAELRGSTKKKITPGNQSPVIESAHTKSTPDSPAKGCTAVNHYSPTKMADQETGGLVSKSPEMFVTRGKSLGSGSDGQELYIGFDENGELIVLHEWVLQCKPTKKTHSDGASFVSRRQKQVQSIYQEFLHLKQFRHRHLCGYQNFNFSLEGDVIKVQLSMEYIRGNNLNEFMRDADKDHVRKKLPVIAKQTLEGLGILHSHGIVHKDLKTSLVFLDALENVRLSGFGILKRLSDLSKSVNAPQRVQNGGDLLSEPIGGKRGDIYKLGLLILSLLVGYLLNSVPTRKPQEISEIQWNFINKCVQVDVYQSLTYKDLLSHQLVLDQPSPIIPSLPISRKSSKGFHIPTSPQYAPDYFGFLGSPVQSQGSFAQQRSRLKSEFDEIEKLGKGGYGEVIKVKNHLDDRIYAIKRVKLLPDAKSFNRKIIREVKLLSQLNHENVVRYFNAWIETYSSEDLPSASILEEDEEDLTDQDFSPREGTSGDQEMSDESDGGSSDDSFITFEAHKPEMNDESDSFITFEQSTESQQVSGKGEDNDDSMVFSMSPSQYTTNTKDILNQLDEERDRSDRSDPVIWYRSKSLDRFEDTSDQQLDGSLYRRISSGTSLQVRYLFIQMEFCDNRTLRDLIDAGSLHCDDYLLWRLLRELVEGLNHIHNKGVIHRDLKPGNVFLDKYGHAKIGDFGLATTHGIRKASVLPPGDTSMQDYLTKQEFSGPVGTFFYTSPEMSEPSSRKLTQKVDIYSLGVIFFEMCLPPFTTGMERHVILTHLRKNPPVLPETFEASGMSNKAKVIGKMLDHNPRLRPSAEELLQSEHLPLKMEDKELVEVLTRTLSVTNSTGYQKLMKELFSQKSSLPHTFAYFYDIQGQKFQLTQAMLHQEVKRQIQSVFERHNAVQLDTPILLPRLPNQDIDTAVFMMDEGGGLLSLPFDLRVSLAKFVAIHEISDLRRFTINRVFKPPAVAGKLHPKEIYECAFDIITDDSSSLIPDAECIGIVSEIISEFPSLKTQTYSIHMNHISLVKAILEHCSVSEDRRKDLLKIHQLAPLAANLEEIIGTELKISKLAASQLARFIGSPVLISEAKNLLDPLLKDKSAIGTMAKQGLHEVETVAQHLHNFNMKETILLNLGMVQSTAPYSGVFFQVRRTGGSYTIAKKRQKKMVLAAGGRFDRLISDFQLPSRQSCRPLRGVGVSLSEDHIFCSIIKNPNAINFPVESLSSDAVLVHWIGLEPLTDECIKVVQSLWRKGIRAQLLYSHADTVEETFSYCVKNSIGHVVLLTDRLYKEKNIVKVGTYDGGKIVEKQIPIADLSQYLQQTRKRSNMKCNNEIPEISQLPSRQISSSLNDLTIPRISISIVSLQKLPGHLKRKIQDQAYNKVVHIVKKLRCPSDVISVDLDDDALRYLVFFINRQTELKDGLREVVNLVCEKCPQANKRLVTKLCEEVYEMLVESKPRLVIFHSSSAEQVYILPNIW